MKKLSLAKSAFFTTLVTGLIITGCKKDEVAEEDYSTDKATMYDQSVADASFDDAGNVADEGVSGSMNTYRMVSHERIQTTCAAITLDTIATPHTAIIDFGGTQAVPCLCNDGNYRSGKILVSWSGNYLDAGSSHTITFDNYYLNFNKIEGTKTVTNQGPNTAGNLVFSINVTGTITVDAQYSYNGTGGTITYTSQRSREWIQGASTPLIFSDDIYLISGSASGTTTAGFSYSMNTDASAPLRKEIGFPHFTSGILNITPGNKPARSVDYSYLNNSRDNLARLTVNGQTFTIKLGRKVL